MTIFSVQTIAFTLHWSWTRCNRKRKRSYHKPARMLFLRYALVKNPVRMRIRWFVSMYTIIDDTSAHVYIIIIIIIHLYGVYWSRAHYRFILFRSSAASASWTQWQWVVPWEPLRGDRHATKKRKWERERERERSCSELRRNIYRVCSGWEEVSRVYPLE